MWNEFKAFLQQSLDDSQAFVDTYWGKIKRDSQYQLEKVLDWTAHLEHLQVVFREFDPATALNKEIMIWCFLKGLRPSIQAQIDVRSQDLSSWEEAIKKAINAEAKAILLSSSTTRDIDSRCHWGNRPAKKEEKDFEKNKSTDSAPADTSSRKQLFSARQTSSANPKKDQDHQRSFRHCGGWGQGRNPDSSAMGVNIVLKKELKDISQVECYNCHQ